jgi:hypothetical protein
VKSERILLSKQNNFPEPYLLPTPRFLTPQGDAVSEKIKITLEQERKIVISQRHLFAHSWCEKCRDKVAILKLQPGTLSAAQTETLAGLLTVNRLHLIEEQHDLISLCLNSLLDSLTEDSSAKTFSQPG